MKVDLDRDDLLRMIYGSSPHKDIEKDDLVKNARFLYKQKTYELYTWSPIKLSKYSDEDLLKLYYLCKKSWKTEDPKVDLTEWRELCLKSVK